MYRYYSIKASPAALSPALSPSQINVWGSRPFISEIGMIVYGTADFPKRLNRTAMLQYGLIPCFQNP